MSVRKMTPANNQHHKCATDTHLYNGTRVQSTRK